MTKIRSASNDKRVESEGNKETCTKSSLASQNIPTGLINGLEMSVSHNFVAGDEIRMSDGAQGLLLIYAH